MTQWVKVPAAKPYILSLGPGARMLEGKSHRLPQVVL